MEDQFQILKNAHKQFGGKISHQSKITKGTRMHRGGGVVVENRNNGSRLYNADKAWTVREVRRECRHSSISQSTVN